MCELDPSRMRNYHLRIHVVVDIIAVEYTDKASKNLYHETH